MRTLLALGTALCLASAVLPARADGPGEFQARARSLQLADDPAWADLLQYEPHPLTRRLRSLADDPGFFNAPDGAGNPAAELDATLARLFEPPHPDDPDSHPQCRFPARLHWLRTRLAIDTATLPAQPCPRLEAWMAEINPAGVTLVFPSAYVNSPASMFGHTLLRIDAVGQTEATRLLAYTINYAAKADATDGFSFALKGLTGLYPGMLSSSPYYVKVREYSDMESRDVWEYRLNLSTAETRQLLRHAWEIGATRFDYWFFDENCSYMMLRLLDVARPGLRISQQFLWTAIPVDTVKGVVAATPGLVTDIHFRASAGTELAHRAGRLAPAQLEAAIAVADGGTAPESLGESGLAIEQLEFADRLVAFRGHGGKLGQDEALARLKAIQTRRSTLPAIDTGPVPVPERPETGHASARAGLAAGSLAGDAALFLELRPAYHDLLDPERGYARGAQIRFGDLAASQREGRGWQLDRLLPVDIVSVAPRRAWAQPLSWKVRFGWERSLGAGRAIAPMLAGGPGAAWEWKLGQRPLLAYAFLENQLLSHAALQKNWAIGSGPLVGVLRDLGEHSRVQIEAGRQWYLDQRLERSSFRARLRTRTGPHSNLVAGYERTQLELPDARSTERSIQLGWQLYF